MIVVRDLLEIRKIISEWRQQLETIAFVPTMGNLHPGHLSLVDLARRKADRVVVSIIVNPLQFGPNEDFATYPRTLKEDLQKLEAVSTDLVFIPSEELLYPHGREQQSRVTVPFITSELCGASRPTFFGGIATAVTKYFNLVQPDLTIFGQKDYQQCLVIKQMIRDFNFPIEFIMSSTVREADGLALSSRNQYLSSEERELAPELYRSLQKIVEQLNEENAEKNFQQLSQALCQDARFALEKKGFSVDYLTVRHQQTLALATAEDSAQDFVVLAAAVLGKTRLIDNLLLTR